MNWLGIDIGGANLKFADGNAYAESHPFAMWKHSNRLGQELRRFIADAPASDHLAITMTGELADCFDGKTAGVEFILEQVSNAADGRHTRIYLTDGNMVTPQVAQRKPLQAASANWHALGRFAGRFAPDRSSLLIDIGSTTCDLIPLLDGEPFGVGEFDTERLVRGELLYTGVERSPVCALVPEVPYRNQRCMVAQELFATTIDVYVILRDVEEDKTKTTTADGRAATKAAARARLGRMICADANHFNHRDAVVMAQAIADAQEEMIAKTLAKVIDTMPSTPEKVVISGQGEFLARRVIDKALVDCSVVSLSQKLGPVVSCCAAAHAVAVLAREAG